MANANQQSAAQFDDMEGEMTYNFIRQGSFGIFRTEWSFPLEFFLLSFTVEDLQYLSLAKDLKPSKNRDFDMLLQRDIDEQRIIDEMEPYLVGKHSDGEKLAEGAVFFPPILAAVVPVTDNDIDDYYEDEKFNEDDGQAWREWHGHFRVQYRQDQTVDAVPIQAFDNAIGKTKKVLVKRNPAMLKMRLPKGNVGRGVKLVVIDGQHRLVTLRNLLESHKTLLDGMVLPVCVVYAPQCTKAAAEAHANQQRIIPKIHEVFRRLFVDVNGTMKRVSGHFEHLLNDIAVETLTARKFCQATIEKYGFNGLACVEWNEKSYKLSLDINQYYSVTSIGVITPLVEEYLENHYEYLLDFGGIEADLFKDNDERRIQYQRLTFYQKPLIEAQIKKNLVPLLLKIFFETEAFKRISSAFNDEISVLEVEAKGDGKQAATAADVLDFLLNYVPLPRARKEDARMAESRLTAFKDAVRARITRNGKIEDPIANRVLFQRAIFETLHFFIKAVKKWNPTIDALADAYCALLNKALRDDSILFSSSQPYMQYLVFNQKRLIVNAKARTSMTNLLLAQFATPGVARPIAELLKIGADTDAADAELSKIGRDRVRNLYESFCSRRRSSFEKNYSADLALGADKRQLLMELEEKKRADLVRAERGEIDQKEISKKFDEAVALEIAEDLLVARNSLQATLNLDFTLVQDAAELTNGDADE